MRPKYEFNTEKGKLTLQTLDSVEPNNGRMLYKISLFLNGTDVTKKYLDNWNFINFFLDNIIQFRMIISGFIFLMKVHIF